jgi:membrane protein DedA with SNARE-associated domain
MFLKELIISYLTTLGLGGLLAGAFIESMGLPFPGGIMVILAGILVNQGRLDFFESLVAAVTGYTMGSVTAYYIGRNLGRPFFFKLGRFFRIKPEKLQKPQDWLDRSAPAFIIFGRFLPGISNLTPYMVGMSRIKLGYFLFYNSLFVFGWAFLYLLLGMFFGHNWEIIAGFLNSRLPLAGLALFLLFLGYLYYKDLLKRKV